MNESKLNEVFSAHIKRISKNKRSLKKISSMNFIIDEFEIMGLRYLLDDKEMVLVVFVSTQEDKVRACRDLASLTG